MLISKAEESAIRLPLSKSFTNAPPEIAGIATVNPNTGAVDSVQITNMGQNLTTPYDPITFTGGLNYSEILITAEVEDLDNPNSVSAVSFYVQWNADG